jgi:MbtH protein
MPDQSDRSDVTIDGGSFQVLLNAEEQYSLWPAKLAVPPGWRQTGPMGTRDDCLAFINATWTDLRPKSLRDAMAMPGSRP